MINKNKYRTPPAGSLHTLIPEHEKPQKGIMIPLIRGRPKQGREATGHITTATIPGNIVAPKAPFFGGYRGVALWPDADVRRNDPALFSEADHETLKIINALVRLNRTGIYSAFFTFWANVGQLEISLFHGPYNHCKKPFRSIVLDCRRFPLKDSETEKEISAEAFEQELILLTQ